MNRLEIRHGEIGLIRPLAKRPLASIDKARAHAVSLGADAIEGVTRDKQYRLGRESDELGGGTVGRDVRLERARSGNRNDMVEFDAEMGTRDVEHVRIAVRQNRELEALL